MKAFMLIVFFVYPVVSRVFDEKCDSKEIIKENITNAYQLALDYDKNMLFFSYDSQSTFHSAYINLKTNELNIVENINGGFTNAVDGQTKTVYLGGSDGIYKFDYVTNKATHIDGTTDNIWHMFVKKDLYYTNYPDENVYVFKNGQAQRVTELLEAKAVLVALDNNDNIYFSNSSGLYVYKKANNYVSFLADYDLNSITSDVNGNLFFSTPSGIYSIDDKSNVIKNIVRLDDIYGIAVENDGNIIYSSRDSIVRLKLSKTNCFTNEKDSVDVV